LYGKRHHPLFDEQFDWKENSRVCQAITTAIKNVEAAWPELVRHLDDERYCITVHTFSGFTYNWTVGNACRNIMGENLAAAYYQRIQPVSKLAYGRLSIPEVARDVKLLKTWCEERKDLQLYELQMEMCEWAIDQLSVYDPAWPTRQRAQEWIKAIEKEYRSLNNSKTAVLFTGYRGDPPKIQFYGGRLAERFKEQALREKEAAK
jgi:hypothetical protein